MQKCSPRASCLFKELMIALYKHLTKLFAGDALNRLILISQTAWNDEASPPEHLMICVMLYSLLEHFCERSAEQWETLPEFIQVGSQDLSDWSDIQSLMLGRNVIRDALYTGHF